MKDSITHTWRCRGRSAPGHTVTAHVAPSNLPGTSWGTARCATNEKHSVPH